MDLDRQRVSYTTGALSRKSCADLRLCQFHQGSLLRNTQRRIKIGEPLKWVVCLGIPLSNPLWYLQKRQPQISPEAAMANFNEAMKRAKFCPMGPGDTPHRRAGLLSGMVAPFWYLYAHTHTCIHMYMVDHEQSHDHSGNPIYLGAARNTFYGIGLQE